MSDLPGSRQGDQPLRSISRPAIVAGVFLGLHVVPLFWRPDALWGVDFLFYLPTSVRALFVLFAVLLFIPGFRRQIRACMRPLPLVIWGEGRSVRITRILILLIALAAFVSLSSARHFLGDGYHVLEKLDAADWHDAYRAPFTYAVLGALHRLGSVLWESAENTYRVYSYVSGILYVLLCFPVAAALGKNALGRSIVLVFLLTAGYIQQFFGYVENYALYLPVLLLYLFLGQRTREARVPLFAPALVMGVMLALHKSLAVFGPSLFYLAYLDYRRERGSIQPWKNLANILAALCCVLLTKVVFLRICGIGFEAYFTGMSGADVLPVFAEPGYYAQYRIFSLEHLVDFINLQLISAPAACMAVFIGRKRLLGRHTFLAICTAIPLFFTFIAKANLGAFRDWDILSLPALPLTLWAATMLLERIRDGEKLFHIAFLICGATALHTSLWIGVNAGAEPAEARFTRQLGRLTGHASATGWVTLGNLHRQQENPSAALEAYKRSLDADPTNSNRWLSVGVAYRKMGQSEKAIEYFSKAVNLRPDHAVPYMNLAAVYYDVGQFANAVEHLKQAIELQPDLADAQMNLGTVYGRIGQYTKAVEHLEKALGLQASAGALQTHLYLGDTYYFMEEYEKAIPHYQQAIQLAPNHANAHMLLGMSYRELNRGDLARIHFEKTLELEPSHPQAAEIRQWVKQIRR